MKTYYAKVKYMYLVKVKVADSKVQGKGVFANQKIKQGEIAWRFTEGHDKSLSLQDYSRLSDEEKEYLGKVAYLSTTSQCYVFPTENDPALYTNHDQINYNLSVVVDPIISPEPHFVANSDIEKGEELTNNYHEFDEAIHLKATLPEWLKK